MAIVFVGGGDCYRVLRKEPMLSTRVYVWQEFRRLDREQVLAVAVPATSCSPACRRPWTAAAHARIPSSGQPRQPRPHVLTALLPPPAHPQLPDQGLRSARPRRVRPHRRRLPARAGRGLPLASTRPAPGPAAVSHQSVQLFLAWLVHESPSRGHTLARLRGAQAGFRLHGFKLDIPPSQRILDVLSGPG